MTTACHRGADQGHGIQGRLLQLQPARTVPAGGFVRARTRPAGLDGRHAPHRARAATCCSAPAMPSSRCTPCAPASSRRGCRPRTGATRSPASRWPANCSAWTASAPTATPATRWRWRTRRSASSPTDSWSTLSREFTDLQRQFHKIMSREIVRDHGVMLLLGSMRAEERLAAFLLNLTQRLQARGFSPSSLVLRMTREEIGSYLGPQARDRQPLLLQVPGRRHPAGQAASDPGAGPGGAAEDRQRRQLLTATSPGHCRFRLDGVRRTVAQGRRHYRLLMNGKGGCEDCAPNTLIAATESLPCTHSRISSPRTSA